MISDHDLALVPIDAVPVQIAALVCLDDGVRIELGVTEVVALGDIQATVNWPLILLLLICLLFFLSSCNGTHNLVILDIHDIRGRGAFTGYFLTHGGRGKGTGLL